MIKLSNQLCEEAENTRQHEKLEKQCKILFQVSEDEAIVIPASKDGTILATPIASNAYKKICTEWLQKTRRNQQNTLDRV